MGEDVEKVLNFMEGQDVNIYQVGKVTSYRLYENFQWGILPYTTGDYLFFSSADSEVNFSILIDEIYETKIQKDGNEIIFMLTECGDIQVWLDIVE